MVLSGCRRQQPPPLPDVALDGVEAGVRKELRRALDEARNAPDDPEAVGRLGMYLHAAQNCEAAVAAYRRALFLAPDEFRWAYYLGACLAASNEPKAAAAAFRRALELNPSYTRSAIRLADQLIWTGKNREARETLLKILAERPGDSAVSFRLGRLAMREGDPAQAAAWFEKALERVSFGAGHYALARAYRALGRVEDARRQLRLYKQYKVRQLPVQDPLLAALDDLLRPQAERIRRARKLLEAGRLWEAIAELEEVLRQKPGDARTHANLVLLYGQAGMLRKAEEHYRLAEEIRPNLPKLHYNWGLALEKQGRFAEARRAFRRAVRSDPRFAYAHFHLARMEARLGDRTAAIRHYRRALRLDRSLEQARTELEELTGGRQAASSSAGQ